MKTLNGLGNTAAKLMSPTEGEQEWLGLGRPRPNFNLSNQKEIVFGLSVLKNET